MQLHRLGRLMTGKVALLASTAIFATGLAGSALAQTAPAAAQPTPAGAPAPATSASPEIIVTAQHRSEALQKVPISITAVSGAELDREGATGFADYLRQVPGVSFVPQGPGLGQLNIRGVETQPIARDQPGVKPSVGIYLDETPIAIGVFNPDLDPYDLSRVEVLRGPQGTLFGSGSLAGTVRFITNKPDPSKFVGSVEASAGGMTGGSADYDGKGMLNIPISANAAFRVVGYENHYGGYIDQVPVEFDGKSYGISKKNANQSDKWGVRSELGFTTGDLTAVLTYVHQRISADGYPLNDITNPDIPIAPYSPVVIVPVTTGLDQQFRQVPESRSDQIDLFSANLTFSLGFANLVSVSSYSRRKLFDSRDYSTDVVSYDSGNGALNGPASLVDRQTVASFSQEVRLVSSGSGPFTWSTGAFFSDLSRRYNQTLPQAGSDAELAVLDPGYTSSTQLGTQDPNTLYDGLISVELQEYAVYGEAKYMFTDKLGLTGGLRGFLYNETNDSAYRGLFGSNGGTSVERTSHASGVSPRGILTYQATSDVLISAQVSRGFRPGSSNDILPPLCGQQAPSQYAPETLTNYEISAKTRFLNGAVTLNGAVYDIEYRNLQLSARLACSFSFITNGGSARSRGVELELTLHPVRNLTINLNGTYQDPKLTSNLPDVAAVVLPGVGDGSRLPGSPKHTLNASFDYGVPGMFGEWAGYAGGNIQNVGGIKTYIQDPNSLDTTAYTLASARLGIRSKQYDISLYIDNIGDTHAELSLEREVGGRYSFVRNVPRTYGVTAHVNF